MKRALACVALIVLLLQGSTPPVAQSASRTSELAFPSGPIVVFVDNKVVDLMWDPVPDASSYRLERDPGDDQTIQPELLVGKLFYRDSYIYPPDDVSYRVCAVLSSSEDCSPWEIVHMGWVKGQLYKNRTWSAESFELDGLVQIMDGTTLTIYNFATVSPMPSPSEDPVIMTTIDSHLVVGSFGAFPPTLRDIRLDINDVHDLQSEIIGEDGRLVTLENVQIGLFAKVNIQYCNLSSSSIISVYKPPFEMGSAEITYNQFQGARIRLEGGDAEIRHNTFVSCSECIRVRQDAKATITDNTFQQNVTEGIDVGGAEATIQTNQFQVGEYGESGVHVWPDSGGKATVSNNTFTGMYTGVTRKGLGVGLFSNPGDPDPPPGGAGPPEVIVEGNVFTNLEQGILIGPEINVEVRSNSFSDNGTSVSETFGDLSNGSLGRVLVYANCIAGNPFGLYGTAGMDASGNWWGSPLGPRTDYNVPVGGGDLISGGALYDPFLQKENCDRQVKNLYVCNMEVTQAIQTYNNTVPLVAGKPAAVRVYPGSATGVISGVTGELIVRRGDTLVGTLQAESDVSTLYFLETCPSGNQYPLRSQKDHSLVFKLPATWTQGTLTLSAEVNPAHSIEERVYGDNTKVMTMTFQTKHPVRVGIVPVNPLGNQQLSTEATDPVTLLQLGTLFRKIYPGHEVSHSILPAIDWPDEIPEPSLDLDSGKQGALLLNTLSMAQMRLRAEGGWDGQAIDQLHGVLPAGTINHSRSEPTLEGGRGTAAYSMDNQVAFTSALSLNLGRTPFPNCSGIIEEWGFDLVTDALYNPYTTGNAFCMSPTEPPDPGQQFWAGLDEYQELQAYNSGIHLDDQTSTQAASPQTYVLIGGVVNKDGKVDFMPAWQVTAIEPPLNPPVGSGYCLELRDTGDSVIASHCFNLTFSYLEKWEGFQIGLPLSGTPAKVVLRQGSVDLGSIQVSASAPSVSIDGSLASVLASMDLPISWSGQDGDGDELVYSVLFSADDGVSWLPVTSNITATHYSLNLAEIPGGGKAWLRVEASDGFNTGMDILGPFTVDSHSPLVAIVQPEAGSVISPTLTLLGYGYDLEDGELEGAALVWTSDRDGELGTGALVYAENLQTGTHRLTLTATDSHGDSTSASVIVGVDATVEEVRAFLPLVLNRP